MSNEIGQQIRLLTREIWERKHKLYNLLWPALEGRPELKGQSPTHFETGDQTWECEKSPVGICVYSEWDSVHDHCIFCGDPDERK